MSKRKKTKKWLHQHTQDTFVKKAQKEGFRSRAVYKLLEIQEKDHILKKGAIVLELGSAPGSFTQIIKKWIGNSGKIIAVDRLKMAVIPGVDFIQGDFTTEEIQEKITISLKNNFCDCIISDMSPDLTGIAIVDQTKMFELAQLIVVAAKKYLRDGGNLLIKLFQGSEFEEIIKQIKQIFAKVDIRKPQASREYSREVYIVAKDHQRNS